MRGELEDIHSFGVKFAPDGYGCELRYGKWVTTNHEYASTDEEHFPIEPELRGAVNAAVARANAGGPPEPP